MPGSTVCLAKLALTQAHFEKLGRQGLKKWCDATLKESRDKFCPVDKGVLKASGKSKTIKNTLTEFYVRLSYSTPYAIYVHEVPAHHPHGSMKYLATPFNLRSYLLIKTLESEMKGAL